MENIPPGVLPVADEDSLPPDTDDTSLDAAG